MRSVVLCVGSNAVGAVVGMVLLYVCSGVEDAALVTKWFTVLAAGIGVQVSFL